MFVRTPLFNLIAYIYLVSVEMYVLSKMYISSVLKDFKEKYFVEGSKIKTPTLEHVERCSYVKTIV
jgi:hypothetical protein